MRDRSYMKLEFDSAKCQPEISLSTVHGLPCITVKAKSLSDGEELHYLYYTRCDLQRGKFNQNDVWEPDKVIHFDYMIEIFKSIPEKYAEAFVLGTDIKMRWSLDQDDKIREIFDILASDKVQPDYTISEARDMSALMISVMYKAMIKMYIAPKDWSLHIKNLYAFFREFSTII